MTADERIEKLLNRFGQTISDLTQPNEGNKCCYSFEDRLAAEKESCKWHNGWADHRDYICHLADVIDRMETALETAALAIDCGQCEYWNDDGCGRNCVEIARITDYQLSGLTEREFNDFVEGEGKTDA